MNTHRTGAAAEDRAAEYLRSIGYRILARNYRFGRTEIDIIAREGAYLVFVEVKYRKDHRSQHPLAAVGPEKQKRISRTALQYLLAHHCGLETPCRFDVLAILGEEMILCRNAFPLQCAKGW